MTTPDGYHVSGQPLRYTILMSYFPGGMPYWTSDRLQGGPSWLDDLYDINAKVAEVDLPEWQKESVSFSLDKKPMFRAMLQAMLAERCRLAVHRVPGSIDGFALVVAKGGPKMTETKPNETLPKGLPLPAGGVLVPYQRGEKPTQTYFGTNMADLAQNLSMMSHGHPVQDRTGLTGRYNFVQRWIDDPDHPGREGIVESNDPDPLSHWDIGVLGLKLQPTKIPTETLVIDHIEKPTEN